MISVNLKSSLAIALIYFVLGCCVALVLVNGCGSVPKKSKIIPAALLKAQADSLHAYYENTIRTLENQNNELNQELSVTRSALEVAKEKVSIQAVAIKKAINSRPKGYPGYAAKDLLQQAAPDPTPLPSDSGKCDSLAQMVGNYLHDSEQKDSLYDRQAAQQDSIIFVKDTIISVLKTEKKIQSALLKQSFALQDELEAENLKLRKQFRRKRNGGRLLAIGASILTGVATHQLSK